eukprot:348437-Rhodomonas_salina.1
MPPATIGMDAVSVVFIWHRHTPFQHRTLHTSCLDKSTSPAWDRHPRSESGQPYLTARHSASVLGVVERVHGKKGSAPPTSLSVSKALIT